MARYDRIVIGGRLVGSAIAYGLVRAGCWRRYSTRATSFSAPRAAISGSSGGRARATARPISPLDAALRR
jgi:glycine/D-amino acid oxidase-like deaminating enzyme